MKNIILVIGLISILFFAGCIGSARTDAQVNTGQNNAGPTPQGEPVPDNEQPTDTYPEPQPSEPPRAGTTIDTQAEARVTINGRALGDAEIREFIQFYGTLPAGDYWYDPVAGLFGRIGYGTEVQIYPGHNLGSPPRDASSGNTGVIVNGREITESEVQYLESLLGIARVPGNYYLDAQGNFGNDVTGYTNLYTVGRSGSGGYMGSNSNSWNSWATDSYGGSQGGCTYVSTDSGYATSGCG